MVLKCNKIYYTHTEKYTPKSYVVNFRTEISSSQSEERTMVFTREKHDTSNQNRERCFFHVWEKWYVQSEATGVCEFRAKIPAFYFAPCKGIRIPESRNFLLLESGILGFGIRNPALGIRNPTKDWNPESDLLKIHSRLDWVTRSKEKPSMESLPRVYASTWWDTV